MQTNIYSQGQRSITFKLPRESFEMHLGLDVWPSPLRWTLNLDEQVDSLEKANAAIGLLQNKENRHWLAYRREGTKWLRLDFLADRAREYPQERLVESFSKHPTFAVHLRA